MISATRSVLGRRWVKVLQAIVTLCLIAWIAAEIDHRVWSSLSQVSIGPLLISTCVFSSAQVFGGLRLAVLIPDVLSWRRAVAATFTGYFWGNFLPGSVGGDIVRAIKLSSNGVNLSEATGALILDRLFNLAIIVAILILSTIPLSYYVTIRTDWKLPAVVVGIFAGVVIAFVCRSRVRFPESIARSAKPFLAIIKSPKRFTAAIFLSLGSVGVSLIAQWILAVNLGIEIRFLELSGIICLVTLLVMLPISINGLGLQEASFVTLLLASGVPEEKAIAFSLLVRFLILWASALAGLTIFASHIRR